MINGKLTNLTAVYGRHRLREDAAAAWLRLVAAYGKQIQITDSYRTYESQERIFLQRYVPQAEGGGTYGDVRHWRGVRYVRRAGTAAAAVPGTSNHGWGLALDLADRVNTATGPAWEWLTRNAHQFGWHNPAWAKKPGTYEPWHWEYNPALDTQTNPDWSSMATPEEIQKIVTAAIHGAIPAIVDQALARVIGKNPATGKDSNVREALMIARNYGYHNFVRQGEILDLAKKIDRKTGK